jgi:molybdopterin-guanine dinucleotide biosynthesis protein A
MTAAGNDVRRRAGFVLTGGKSSRMGRDKASLPFGATTLVEHVVACLRAVTQDVTLIGSPERYRHLAAAAIADRYENCGPLGGVCTALETTAADFNVIVACDMPGVNAEFFRSLWAAAEAHDADCLVPETSDGLHPLCAAYHRRVQPIARRCILSKSVKMHDFVASLNSVSWPVAAGFVENVNTPLDWRHWNSSA